MALRTHFVVQAFEHVQGRLVATARNTAPSESFALKQAGGLAARLAWTAAFRIDADRASETSTILGAFGDVLDDISEELAGG